MQRTLRRVGLVAILAMLLASPASAADPQPRYSAVVVVLAPYLSWSDLSDGTAPTIGALTGDAAIACVNVRAGSLRSEPDGLYGAAVLSAGRSLSSSEADSIVPGLPFGALATAVRANGGATAAIGSSAIPTDEARSRPAPALVLGADGVGSADIAETSERLLKDDATAPLRVTANLLSVERAFRTAVALNRPLLIAVDPGDGERARAQSIAGGGWAGPRAAAVRTADAVVARVLRNLPPDAALIVVSTASYAEGGTAGFGPLVLYANGPGILSSASTHREGVVTLPDVSATALDLVGLAAPQRMAGSPLRVTGAERGTAERLALMSALDRRATSLESLREPVWFGFIAACLAIIAGSMALVFLAPPGRYAPARRALPWALIALLAVPPGSLVAVVGGGPGSQAAAWAGLAAGTVAVLALSLAWPRRDPVHTLGRLIFLTLAIVLGDQLLGGPLANGTAFSYSTLFGARYYGLGNEGAAVLLGAVLIGIGWRIDHYGRDRAKGFLVTGSITVIVSVLPFLGANVGVAAWGVVAVVTAYLLASGRRLTWRIAAAAFVAVAAMVGVAVLADAAGAGSHLGNFVQAIGGGGAGVGAMLARKVELSWGVVRATPVVVILPIALGAIAYALIRPRGPLGAVLVANRGLAAALGGIVAGALVAAVTEDSSVVIGAILLLYGLAALGVVALGGRPDGEVA